MSKIQSEGVVLAKNSAKNVPFLLIALIFFIFIGIAFCPAFNENVAHSIAALTGGADSETSAQAQTIFEILQYNRSIHILAMLLLGFGFLMCFVRGHGFSSITATLLAVSVSIPVYMLFKSFIGEESALSIEAFLFAEFCAASLLITIGAPLGRLKMDQYLLLGVLFVPIYFFNEWLVLESGYFEGFLDTGGSVLIHAFGAYFGLGVITGTYNKFKNGNPCDNDSTSNQFCLLGSLILWVFWPSFTSAIAAPDRIVLTAINTIFALCGATIATYIFSKLIRGHIDVEDIANAALAGGVAIGSTCDLGNPGMSMLIGIAAGALSTCGFSIIAPKVQNLIKGTDTCGVHNLHGMPGLLGGLSAIIITGNVGIQLFGIVTTVVIAFVGGKIAGIIIGLLGTKSALYSDADEFEELEYTKIHAVNSNAAHTKKAKKTS
ncbi:ammonium transporter [Clostridium aminobutyricum]|uniref:Ammonium transporter n=1 Tax=Clostridium aminobutyricum TaxID=33953 RepID=A0A939IK35_CLOAM|nr:ammonium transporter [Clostridium aminobutyricum]MBN7774194.1 ammonium transporter [Clostridium aminobutyricum]